MNIISILVASVAIVLAPSAGQEGPQNPAPPAQSASLASERRELAEIQLLLGADRDYAQAKERLVKLGESLAGRTDKEAKELQGRVEQLERKVRRALGEPVPDDLDLLVDVLKGKSGDKVDEAVVNALLNNDFGFVRQLGKRAAPGLAQVVRARPDEFPGEVARDPLLLLMQCDPLAASELVEELLDLDGFLWRRRLFRAFREADPLASASVWTPGEPKRCLADGLVHALEKYAADPDVGNQVLQRLDPFLAYGLTPVLREALIAALRSPDLDRRNIAWGEIWPIPALQTEFEELQRDADSDLRIRAAEKFLVRLEVLYERVDDPEPRVRRAVAEGLVRSDKGQWSQRERDTLARLLHDTDAEVRKKAWSVLQGLPIVDKRTAIPPEEALVFPVQDDVRAVYRAPLPDEVYRSLLQSEERGELCAIARKLPPALCFELLQTLAADEQAEVLEKVVGALQSAEVLTAPEAALRVCSTLLDNAALEPVGGNPFIPNYLVSRIARTRKGLDACLRWLLAREDDALIAQIILHPPDPGMHLLGYIEKAEPGLAAAIVARVFAIERDGASMLVRVGDDNPPTPELARAFRELARDGDRPVGLRILALHVALTPGGADEDYLGLVRAVAAAPGWREPAELQWSRDGFVKLLGRLQGNPGNAVILGLLRDPSSPDDLVSWTIQRMSPTAAGAAEITKLVLARGFGKLDWQDAVGIVLQAMGSVPDLQDPEALARAAREPLHAWSALQAIRSLSDPRYLPVLAEIIERPADASQLDSAAKALLGYLDAEAVEPLLRAAAKVQGDTRDKCLAQLEKIREYQDSRERWATRTVKTATREQVVAQLVEQLSSKSDDVKVQAIRALATWEAVEVMPKLIELTTSGSKSVAAAAREALERLNAPKKD